jgi:hypothetical protein
MLSFASVSNKNGFVHLRIRFHIVPENDHPHHLFDVSYLLYMHCTTYSNQSRPDAATLDQPIKYVEYLQRHTFSTGIEEAGTAARHEGLPYRPS